GSRVSRLKDLILAEGDEFSKKILEKEKTAKLAKEQEGQKKTEEIENVQHGNLAIVAEIVSLRSQINFKTQARENFKFQLFYPEEGFIKQTEIANDESSLIQKGIEFRAFVSKFSPDVSKHGLESDKIKELLPDATEEGRN